MHGLLKFCINIQNLLDYNVTAYFIILLFQENSNGQGKKFTVRLGIYKKEGETYAKIK